MVLWIILGGLIGAVLGIAFQWLLVRLVEFLVWR